METYNKLVRDKIPSILDEKGIPYEQRVASPEEYKAELVKKLKEETDEFLADGGSVEELADILEVIDAMKALPDYQNVVDVQLKKREERGSFEQRLILKGEKR